MLQLLKAVYIKRTPFQWLCFCAIVFFGAKLALIPYVHPIDADGISRVYASLQWADYPEIIKSGNWPPFHFYLTGLALQLHRDIFITPVVLNILLSVLMLFPFYFLIRRLFDDRTALFMSVLLSFSPIVFRLSLLAMSEIPALFFLLLSANVLVKGLKENKNKYILLAGLLCTVAGGFRYESWVLSFVFSLFIWWRFSFQKAICFLLPALVFPVYWLLSNAVEKGNMLSSFTWAFDAAEKHNVSSLEDFLRGIWYYPLALMFAFGPVASFFFLKEIVRICKNRRQNKTAFIYFVFFVVLLVLFIVNCVRGSFLLQQRFVVTYFILVFPFLAYYFSKLKQHGVRMVLLFSVTAFFLAFVYSSKGARPIPRLLKKDAAIVSNVIQQQVRETSGLIVDDWDWETTYYLAFMTRLPLSQIAIFDQHNSADEVAWKMELVLRNQPEGILTLCPASRLIHELVMEGDTITFKRSQIKVQVERIYQHPEVTVYNYKVL